MRTRVAGLLLVATLLGCSAGSLRDDPFDSPSARPDFVRLQVINQNFQQATVTVVSEGMRTRLGRVGGKSESTFRVRWPNSRIMRLHVQLLAGSDFQTPPLTVDPGDALELVIQNPLFNSQIRR